MTSSVSRVYINKPILEFCDYLQKKKDSTSFFVRLDGSTKVDNFLLLRNFCYNFYIGAGKLHFQLS